MTCVHCGAEYPDGAGHQSICSKCGGHVQAREDHSEEDILAWAISAFEEWEAETETARTLSERDDDYYHGLQWTPEEITALERRNQPVLTKNRTAKKINFILGNEIVSRTDPKCMPRTKKHANDAPAMTDALRYIADDNDLDFIVSEAYRDVLIKGYGGCVVEHEVADGKIKIKTRHVAWDRLWADIRSRKPDYSDATHLGISTWWYVDQAKAYYAKHPNAVEGVVELIEEATGGATGHSQTHDDKPTWVEGTGTKRRIRVSEVYYEHVDPKTQKSRWYTCHYSSAGPGGEFLVKPRPTGYLDENGNDVCPLLMFGAFVTKEGRRYGMIRNMISPQDEVNKRASKALHHMTVDRTTYEEGAIADPGKYREERAKPDGMMKVQPKALSEARVVTEKGLDMAQAHLTMLQEAKQDIDQIGPEIPQIGAVSGASSGIAIQQRQQIGMLEIAVLRDNLGRWKRKIFTHYWYGVRQFWPNETWLRVTDDTDTMGYRFVGLNREVTRAQRAQELLQEKMSPPAALEAVGINPQVLDQAAQMLGQRAAQAGQQVQPQQLQQLALKAVLQSPEMQEKMTAADVSQLTVDILIEEAPDVAIVQHEELKELREVLQTVLASGVSQQDPGLPKQLIEMIIEAGQLRSKKKLLAMMRKPPDPQQVQQQQAQQQMAMEQMKLQLQQMQAQIQKLGTASQLDQAKTAETMADAQATQMLTPTEAEKNRAQAEKHEADALKAAADAGVKTGEFAGPAPSGR